MEYDTIISVPVRTSLGLRGRDFPLDQPDRLTALARLLAGFDLAPSRRPRSDVTSADVEHAPTRRFTRTRVVAPSVGSEASLRFDTIQYSTCH